MDTIEILDNYKISLTDDSIYLKVLSVILLYFKIKEEDLCEIISELKQKKGVIVELFKSGLIEKNIEDNALILTNKAERILEGFNMNSSILKVFVDDLPLNRFDKVFLNKSIEYFDYKNTNKKDLSTLLRTLTIFSKALRDDKKYTRTINENAFIIIFHLNTHNWNISDEILFNEIKLYILDDDLISLKMKKSILERKDIYKKKINICHEYFVSSNSQHFVANNYDDLIDEHIVFLTALRHTNCFYHNYCDSELFNLSIRFDDSVSPFREANSKKYSEVFDKLKDYFSEVLNKSFSVSALNHSFFELKKKFPQEKNKAIL